MKLTCVSCQTGYRIEDEKIPAGGARANCPNCGQVMVIPAPGSGKASGRPLMEKSGVDYGQTMAYEFSEVDQSRTEISAFLEKVSELKPHFHEGLSLYLREDRTGAEHAITSTEATVGRSGADITVDDPEVSRKHCLIKVFGGRIVIVDLDSTNGTRFEGRRVMTASLQDGESFSVGNTVFTLVARATG